MLTKPCLVFFFLIQIAFYSKAQTILITDTCTNNTSTFKRINDSLFYVESHYNGKLVFSGGVIRPDTSKIFIGKTSDYLRLDDTCIFNDDLGRPLEKRIYKNEEKIENWFYKDYILNSYYKSDAYGSIEKTYTNGIISKEILFVYKTRVRTTIYYKQGKKLIRREKQNPLDRDEYEPIDKVTYYYYEKDLTLWLKVVKEKSGVKTYYNYHQNKLNRIAKYDKNGEMVMEKNIFSSGKADRKTNYYIKKDKNYTVLYKKIIYQRFENGKPIHRKDTAYLYIKDTVNKTIWVKGFSGTEFYKWDGESITYYSKVSYRDEMDDSSRVTQETHYTAHHDTSYMVIYKNKKKEKSSLVIYNTSIHPPVFSETTPDNIGELFANGRDWERSHELFYDRINEIEENNDLKKPERTDTLFENGKPFMIEYYIGSNRSRYFISNNIKRLAYDDSYRIAKDINECTEGLKDPDNHWAIPAEYTLLVAEGYDTNTLYFAEKNELTTIFDWKGQQLIGPLRGIMTPDIYNDERTFFYLDTYMRDSLGIKDNRILIINNDKTDQHYLINFDSVVLLSIPYPIIHSNSIFNMRLEVEFEDKQGNRGIANLNGVHVYNKNIDSYLGNGYAILKNHKRDSFWFLNPSQTKMDIPCFHYYDRLNDSLYIINDWNMNSRLFNTNRMKYVSPWVKFYLTYHGEKFNHQILENGKYGIVDLLFNYMVPPKYSHISRNTLDDFIAYNQDTIDFYSKEGVLKNSLVCDSLYQNFFGNINDKVTMFYNVKGKYGLVNSDGKILVQAIYDMIGEGIFGGYVLIANNKIISAVKSMFDSVVIIKNFLPQSHYLNINNVVRSKTMNTLCFDAFGNYIDGSVTHNWDYKRTKIYEVTENGKTMGYVNSLGQWVNCTIKIPIDCSYKNTTKDGKTGVCNCKEQCLVPRQYQYIYFDFKYNLLWYNGIPVSDYQNRYDDYENIWHIKNITNSTFLRDTFNYPISFNKGICITTNNHEHYGVFDSVLNVLLPFKFTSYRFNSKTGLYFFYHKDKETWICNRRFEVLKKMKLSKLTMINETQYIGFNDSLSFWLDINFNVIDSSSTFFSTNTVKLQTIDNQITEDIEESNPEENEETIKVPTPPKTEKSKGLENFITCLNAYNNVESHYQNLGFQPVEIYPRPNIHSDYFSHYSNLYFNNYKLSYSISPIFFNLKDYKYKPTKFTVNGLVGLGIGELYSFTPNVATFNEYFSWNKTKGFETFYLDSVEGVLMLPLNELVDYEKRNAFVSLIRKHLSTLDNPEIPCFNPEDYIDFFQNQYSISSNGFTFHLPEMYNITIPVNEMKTILNPYWKERF